MKNAFLFPGQGSQEVGMGQELYGSLPQAGDLLDRATGIVGYDLKDLMFNGPAEKLTDTQYAQPAIYTCSAIHLERAKAEGIAYDFVAGHSLGEYSALYAAGVLSFEDGLKLVNIRGRAMAKENGKGSMAAVLGMTEEELAPLIGQGVVMANLNTETQIVVSGTDAGISELAKKLEGNDNVTVRRLNVSAAFHSPQMQEAQNIMKEHIDRIDFKEPSCYVVPNVTGKATKDVSEIKECLIAQITGQVRWYDSIIAIKNAGIERFYECGNGKVLRKMNRAITLDPKCLSI